MTVTAPEGVVDAEIVRTADEWAEIIRAEMARTAESIVLTGQYLIAAKADVAHGAWLPMLASIGVSHTTAKKLMSVGRNASLSNSPTSDHLPPALDALYELSRLAPEAVNSGVESGDVHPGMTIKDAKGYAAEVAERAAPANVNTDAGEILGNDGLTDTERKAYADQYTAGPGRDLDDRNRDTITKGRDRKQERAEREASIVNDLRLYLRHIGTDKAITGMTPNAKRFVIEALEEAAANLKESM